VIHARTVLSLVGVLSTKDTALEWKGQTIREVIAAVRREEWGADLELQVFREGKLVPQAEWDLPLASQVWLVIAPMVGDPLTGAAVNFLILGIFAAVSAASRPKTKDAVRGDDVSPTYAWDGTATTYGSGAYVPLVYGEVDLGGQVVSTNLYTQPAPGGGIAEYLEQIIMLGEGRFESIGGMNGGTLGEADDLGALYGTAVNTIPADIRVNGNPLLSTDAEMAIRLGRFGQTPMRQFANAATTLDVGAQLDAPASFEFVINDTTATSAAVRLTFASGLYKLQSSGAYDSYPVTFWLSFKTPTTGYSAPQVFDVALPAQRAGFSLNPRISFQGLEGPFTVRVERRTAAKDPVLDTVSTCAWSKVVVLKEYSFSYPGRVCVAARLRATERLSGNVQWLFRVKGRRIRAWDAVLGWTDYLYESPTTGPFAGIWSYPIGNNPAWVLLDLLLSPDGLGRWVKETDVDLQSFRDWADFCDSDATTTAGTEALMRFDGVFDSGQVAWDAIQQVCAAGRASPALYGSRISVIYRYRDAHGRGTNSIPAKGGGSFNLPTMTFATSNIEDFKLTYRSTENRPNVYDCQILNRASNYTQATITVPDPTAVQTPLSLTRVGISRKTLNMFGVVRESQARRDALFAHAIARLSNQTVVFSVGADGMGLNPGQLIGVQHDAAQVFVELAYAYRTSEASVASTTVRLDHALTVPGSGYAFDVVQVDGTVAYVAVAPGTYAAGDAITVSAPVTCKSGAVVAYGKQLKNRKLYEVLSISARKNQKRSVTATNWDPTAYDAPAAAIASNTPPQGTGDDAAVAAVSAQASSVVCGATSQPGTVIFNWEQPDAVLSRPARVYARTADTQAWTLIGESVGRQLDTTSLVPGQTYQIAVALQDGTGRYQPPSAATPFTIRVPEFRVEDTPSPTNLTASVQGDGLLLQWSKLDDANLAYYEVRRGTYWNGAQVVARVQVPFLFVPDPAYGIQRYFVRARYKGGLYSGGCPSVAPTFSGLSGNDYLITNQLDLSSGLLGPLPSSELYYDATAKTLSLAAGSLHGVYSGVQIDIGVVARLWWSVWWDTYEQELTTGAELSDVSGAELRWRTGLGREASGAQAGADFDVAGVALLELGSDSERKGSGPRGFVGQHTRIRCEQRFDTTGAGAWTAWMPQRNQWFAAQKMEVRFTFDRDSERYQAFLSNFASAVLI